MVKGIKSKTFGCIWKTMFIIAETYPEKIDLSKKEHINKHKNFKNFYHYLGLTIPCKFCREFVANTLTKELPLDFSGRIPLMFSIYKWKDKVNKKLSAQGYKIKPSPPFKTILKRYDALRASCKKTEGVCK